MAKTLIETSIKMQHEKKTGLTQFLHLLSEHILHPDANATEPSAQSVLRRASEFLCRGQDDGSSTVRETLFSPVVYVVLNFPHQRDSKNRWFVGMMNADNIASSTREYLNAQSECTKSNSVNDVPADRCDLDFAGGQVDPNLVRNARCAWGKVWQQYQEDTQAGMLHHRFTWNQYLAHNARHPRVMGLTWDHSHDEDLDEFYWRLPEKLARTLNIKVKHKATTLDAMSRRRSFASLETTPLLDLANTWGKMEPSDPQAVLTENVAFSVYHLTRSFAFWGGSSFLSIPIRHSSDGIHRTAILSLCTNRELYENEISRWDLIATKILSPLLSAEESDMRRRAERTTAVEAGEHTAKNAVKATGWRRGLQAVSSALSSDHELPHEIRCALEVARRALANFMMVEGQHGVRRLFALCAQSEFKKIENWTSKSAVSKWRNGGDEIRDKWDKYLENIIFNLLYGLGWKNPVEFKNSRGVEWSWLGTAAPRLSPAELWENDGALPPFILSEGSDSHFALLACLIEPLANAARSDRTTDIRIEIGWEHPNGISVRFKNGIVVGADVDRNPPGLALLQTQMRESHLAHVLDPEVIDGDSEFSVTVMLHPHRLADLILGN